MAKKLAKVGLIPKPDVKPAATLGPFLKSYIDGRADLKAATKIVRGQVIRDLKDFFGESREVATITPGNADDFKQWLVARGLAATTVHKRLQSARSFFHAMWRRKLIVENPFDGVKAAATGIKDRQRFVMREEIARVLAACPDHHWRTIVALSRYGGLRCPSEVLHFVGRILTGTLVGSWSRRRRLSIMQGRRAAQFRCSLSCAPPCRKRLAWPLTRNTWSIRSSAKLRKGWRDG